MHCLHLVHVKDEQGHWFVNIFFVQVPPNHQATSVYLVMTSERFLNSLLLVGLLPLNSTHLF
jgi:hypothetical protein